jgi:predicted small integral membrane protein
MLRNEIFGDLWRGSVGMAGSWLAVMSSMHEDIDEIAKTVGMILGCLASLAMFISLCQRIYHNWQTRKWEGVIFKQTDDDLKK